VAGHTLLLDAGAILAWTRRDPYVRALIAEAINEEARLAIPPSVITQTVRGDQRDAPINRLVHIAHVPFVGERLARRAGSLLAQAGLSDAVDAQVIAEAERSCPCTILTSDPTDLAHLAEGIAGIRIIAV
jgi:predicted nucleic acid-binding protein